MAIQEDQQISRQEGEIRIKGLVNLGKTCDDMQIMNSQTEERRMTKYILQFIFLGYDGFRFPVAYFPTSCVNAPDLYMNVWNIISELYLYGFCMQYVCIDGGSSNMAFQLMHFNDKLDAFEKNSQPLTHFIRVKVFHSLWTSAIT